MGKWQVLQPDPQKVKEIAESYKVDRLLARCILNRNVTEPEEMKEFLDPGRYTPPDPFLMPDMDKAVARIMTAVENGERICIYGDYDADGVTAIAILTQAVRELGGDAFYYIPDRFFEGVGLNPERLVLLRQKENVALVITVDTGVRAFKEMEVAREQGLDVIITDHHTPDNRRPDALAVLNPKLEGSHYPFLGLCGAGVALKLVQALAAGNPGKVSLDNYLQIAAIGTIADMVPLREENRWIVFRGLRAMESNPTGPLRHLLRRVGIRGDVNAMDVSFKVAPRINAPGRLGDPDIAINFFNCTDEEEIVRIVEIMDGMNTIRQMVERELGDKLEMQLRHSFRNRVPPFILLAGRHWHRGILGIMACKLVRRYDRPACVISFDANTAHGSIRSVPGLDILGALRELSHLLTNFGGHPEAAGVTLPLTNLPLFKQRMNELLGPRLQARQHLELCSIDAQIDWQDLTDDLFENLSKMAPFGIGNAMPVFLSPNLILETDILRKGPWYHFEVSDGNISRKCSFYHPIELEFKLERFDSVDLVYSLAPFRDEYQVQIVEIRPSRGEHGNTDSL
ncbi:MAG: single-stranded-DNA-specific exonuclease RecJ [Acidobacteriota bacterium]|nr:single-stranded-DNA-specific exonuclease RecJ [Acidobacteriota bacterium]